MRNTSNTTDQEREWARRNLLPFQNEILAEHRDLVIKKFREGLSTGEERRMVELDTLLDRIEDALNGKHLDQLEEFVARQRGLAKIISDFVGEINNLNNKEKGNE